MKSFFRNWHSPLLPGASMLPAILKNGIFDKKQDFKKKEALNTLKVNIEFDFVTAIVFALISQGVFASIVLILKQENRAANRYLSTLSFLLALWLCDTFFRVSGIYSQNPNFYFLPIYYSLAFGPLIFFYTKKLTEEKSTLGYREAVHFLPVFLQLLFYLYLQINNYSYRRDFWLEVHRPYTYNLELILSFISLIAYLILSRRLIKKYKRKIENSFSSTYRIALQWLNQLHLALSGLSFLWLLEATGRLIWNYYPITPFSTVTIGIIILVIAVGGILQKDLQPVTNSFQQQNEDRETPVEGKVVNIDDVKRIQSIMAAEQLFLQQELTLKEFAKEINMAPREASRLINQGLNMSFIDFVNQYRVKRFKELVKSDELKRMSILGLAYESGFNSKSTFNRVFKKMEGKSPTAYLNESHNVD